MTNAGLSLLVCTGIINPYFPEYFIPSYNIHELLELWQLTLRLAALYVGAGHKHLLLTGNPYFAFSRIFLTPVILSTVK